MNHHRKDKRYRRYVAVAILCLHNIRVVIKHEPLPLYVYRKCIGKMEQIISLSIASKIID